MLAAALTLLGVAAYGGLHSLLATHWAKDQARRLFGQGVDRIYRLAYNIVGALTLIPVLAIPARLPGRSLYQVPWPWAGLALALQLAALLVVVLGVMQTDAWHFLGLRQLVGAEQHPPKLVVSGLYRWVRHPLYSGGLVFLWLTPFMTTSLLALYTGLSAYLYLGSTFEERRLLAEFGEAYAQYQHRVPRLVPRPWRRFPEVSGASG